MSVITAFLWLTYAAVEFVPWAIDFVREECVFGFARDRGGKIIINSQGLPIAVGRCNFGQRANLLPQDRAVFSACRLFKPALDHPGP